MPKIVPKIGKVGAQQDPPATAEGYGHAVRTDIKAGNLANVQCLLDQWRLDASVPGPSPKDIKYMVPRAAENNGEPEILGYPLSQDGEISSYTISRTTSINIFGGLQATPLESRQYHTSDPCFPPRPPFLLPLP